VSRVSKQFNMLVQDPGVHVRVTLASNVELIAASDFLSSARLMQVPPFMELRFVIAT
jgi:hypothetical protein